MNCTITYIKGVWLSILKQSLSTSFSSYSITCNERSTFDGAICEIVTGVANRINYEINLQNSKNYYYNCSIYFIVYYLVGLIWKFDKKVYLNMM